MAKRMQKGRRRFGVEEVEAVRALFTEMACKDAPVRETLTGSELLLSFSDEIEGLYRRGYTNNHIVAKLKELGICVSTCLVKKMLQKRRGLTKKVLETGPGKSDGAAIKKAKGTGDKRPMIAIPAQQ